MMRYEVRFRIDGEERTIEVEADSAADAAQQAQEEQFSSDRAFELIQVHLLDDHVAEQLGSERHG
jgi:hypothetical protein